MRPASYVVLDALPLLGNGKIDRRALALRELGGAAPASTRSSVPCDDVERTLCRIWEELLGVEVAPDDDFFALGGHSLMVARLFARLDRTFGRALPLATVFKAPTVRQLARYYREGIGESGSSALVAISVAGSLPPIFGLPGVSGNVLCFADIVRELGPAQPFYGLQSIGLDGTCEPIETIEDMAARYLAEVRGVQARGPYYLIGACFGATVAFDMARQLLDAGEDVAFLGLIEPSSLGGALSDAPRVPVPPALKRGFAVAGFVADRLRLYRDEMRGLPLGAQLKFVRGKLGIVGEALQKRDVFRGDRREFDQRRVNDANVTALLRYKHAPLSRIVDIEIFTSGRRITAPSEYGRIDWNRITRGTARYHRVPGKDSGDMLQGANARALAVVLSSRLHHARA
jgi:hypothetical protein